MYTTKNFKTKKELKAAVQAWNGWNDQRKLAADMGAVQFHDKEPLRVTYFQPGPFGGNEPRNGTFCVEGPQYPAPHRWYATCTAENGVIVKVK